MKNKKAIQIIAILMAVLMVLGLVVSVVPIMADAVFQEDIDRLQAKKDSLAVKSEECQSKIEQLRDEQAAVIKEKAALDERSEYAEEQIKLTDEQISIYDKMIAEKALEVDKAKAVEKTQLAKYRARIRAMEENGGYNILSVILKADSFASLLAALDDVSEVMESDKLLEERYIAAREALETVMTEYEEYKAQLDEKKAELETEKAELEKDIKEAEELIASLEEDIEKAIQEYTIAEQAEAAAGWELSALVAQLNAQNQAEAAEKAAQQAQEAQQTVAAEQQVPAQTQSEPAAQQTQQEAPAQQTQQETPAQQTQPTAQVGIGTGTFVWPVPSSYTVTSRYGMRVHPITGQTTMHNGIDIDGYGRDGYPIVASDSGVVATATYSDSYGNYVLIDHKDGRQTLYAHCSGLAVSVGDTVTQGQTIGYLGATGWATGTHCHFEIFINGGRVDPAGYFGGISYYDC